MLEVLRSHILESFGSPVNSPKDCEILSQSIASSTKRSISPTTLRRFFGLLPSNSSISAYNLDTLSIYTGAADYDSFCRMHSKEGTYHDHGFGKIIAEFEKLTDYTLKSISRKSLTDFSKTIPRKEMNRRLTAFVNSDQIVYPLIAPGGYGKSVALVHWVKQYGQTDLVLFCPASIYYAMLTLKTGIRTPLNLDPGSPGNMFDVVTDPDGEAGRRLVIVLDALDEMGNEPEKLYSMTDHFFDVANGYAGKNRVKFIFSVREAVWHSYLVSRFIKMEEIGWLSKTDPVFENGYTNIPLLSNTEIRDILAANRTDDELLPPSESIPWNIRELMRIPLYMHVVLELLRHTNTIDHLSQVDITREYLREFIFQSRYAEQKEDLVWKILELMERLDFEFMIPKNELKRYFPIHLKRETDYYKAYSELLHSGILVEERIENKYGIFVSKVGFKHQNFQYYLLALYMVRENGGLDRSLINSVAEQDRNRLMASSLVALFYEIAYENEDSDVLSVFCSLQEEILGSMPVKFAVGNSFRKGNSIRDALIRQFAASPTGRKYFFEQFVDTNYMFNNFRFRIVEYLKHANDLEASLFGHSILFLAAFLEMDRAVCLEQIEVIRGLEPDSSVYPWPVGRKVASHILEHYIVEGNRPGPELEQYISKYTSIARSYKGCQSNRLVEFELPVMVALVLIQKFDILEKILVEACEVYGLNPDGIDDGDFLAKSQNSLVIFYLEYARFKLGKSDPKQFPGPIGKLIMNFYSTFDDFQYLILADWFFCDYYISVGQEQEAMYYYNAALELAVFAEYDFYRAFLLRNDPLQRPVMLEEARAMIKSAGYDECLFTFHHGAYSEQ